MVYCLGLQSNKLENDKNISVIQDIREMSQQEIQEYKESLKVVAEYRNLKNSIYLLSKNYEIFESFLLNPECGTCELDSLNEKLNILLLEANSVFSNLLFSLTATKHHFEFLVDEIDKNEYREKTNYLYKSDNIYGFIWELRNYAQHFFLPFTDAQIHEYIQNDEILKNIEFKINKNELLKNKKDWKIAKSYLLSLPDFINIIVLIRYATLKLIGIYNYFSNKKLKRIEANLIILSNWFNEIQKFAIENKILKFYPCVLELESNQKNLNVKMGKLELELLVELGLIQPQISIPNSKN